MISITILCILFLVLFTRQLKKLHPHLRTALWLALIVHVCITGFAHYRALEQDPTGVIIDSSVDAQKYFFSAEKLSEAPFWTISPMDVTRASGSTWHIGYYYVNLVAIKLSSDPMLLVRAFKVALYFLALVFTARVWQHLYGRRAALWGVLYLGFGWWEIIYFNIRNYKDGLLVSICLFVYALILRGLPQFNISHLRLRIRKSNIAVWAPVMVCLIGLVFLRIYLPVCIGVGVVLHLTFKSRLSEAYRILVTTGVMLSVFGIIYAYGALGQGWVMIGDRLSMSAVSKVSCGMAKTVFAPIPWQYTERFLIPSQFIYLAALSLGVVFLFVRIRPIPWWQVITVTVMVLFLGLMVDSARTRKRMPLVPIVACWIVMGAASPQAPELSCLDSCGESLART